MDFVTFRQRFFDVGIFTTQQVRAVVHPFSKDNLGRWTRQGWLIRLKNGMYAFSEYRRLPGFAMMAANAMYKPSYISLESAMAFYDMIPESVVQTTSVTSIKTWNTENALGQFVYRNIASRLMFGYDRKQSQRMGSVLLATPEKALLDFLYLNPQYKTEADLEELRLDEDFLATQLDKARTDAYLLRFGNNALSNRVLLLYKVYGL